MSKIVKLGSKPWIPNPKKNWEVGYNNSLESIEISKLALHLEPEQKKGSIKGKALQSRMHNKGLGSNVLEYLLHHPKEIPEKWKEKTNGQPTWIYFWGTKVLNVFNRNDIQPYVCYLAWDGKRWDWHVSHIPSQEFTENHPAAVLSA